MVERRRTSLAQYHGTLALRGDSNHAATLAAAWRAATSDGRELTHGFHPYPARLHPQLARTLIAAWSKPGDVVIDPFCGSGTVLVEARAAGRRALGCDVNALALLLARQKSAATTPAGRQRLLAAGDRLARRAWHERSSRDEAITVEGIPPDLARWYEPHVLQELDTLGCALQELPDREVHDALLLVFSSLLTKVSRRAAETSDGVSAKRIAPGFTAKAFAQRTEELCSGLAELATLAHQTPAARVVLADARALPWRTGSAQFALSSPPYLGTYDYDAIQELRARLLAIPLRAAAAHEIGRRSQANANPTRAAADYVAALRASGSELARVVRPGGLVVLVVGDSEAAGREFDAAALVAEAFAGLPLHFVAAAAQTRESPASTSRSPTALSRRSRAEHLLAFRRA